MLTDGFTLEFEWQQVSSSLQDSSQYSGRPQQCYRSDSLYPSANFQISTIVTFMFQSFFNSLARSRYLSFFSLSLRFILWSAGTANTYCYYYYYYYYYWRFFTPVKSVWHQIFSVPQDFSRYHYFITCELFIPSFIDRFSRVVWMTSSLHSTRLSIPGDFCML